MRNILLTFVLLFSSVSLFSQIEFQPGVRAGVNFANITNADTDSKTDFYIGALGSIKFVSFYTLQPELNYSRQGASFDIGDDAEIQYLALTVANKFSPFKDNGLHAIVGPSFNFKVGDNFENDDAVESFDFGVIGGLGYDFPFGLTLEARFNIGFVDIFGSNINNEVSIDELFVNKVFQIGGAYKFDF